MIKPRSALVIGGEHNALAVIRGLGKAGIKAYGLISDTTQFARYSKYCVGSYVAFDVARDPTRLQRALTSFTQRGSGPIYLHPTSDRSTLIVSQSLKNLPQFTSVVPQSEIVETFIHKPKFYQSLARQGIPHPKTYSFQMTHNDPALNTLQLPVFLKPAFSQTFFQRFQQKGFVASTRVELAQHLAFMTKHRIQMVVQEYVPGPTSYGYILRGYLNHESQPLFLFASRKLRQPSLFAIESAQVSVPLHEVTPFVQIILNYLQNLHYTGLWHAEFKRDARDNTFKLLEINPRSGGGCSHPIACGANHVELAYRDALGLPVTSITSYQVGVYSTDFLYDLRSIVSLLRTRQFAIQEIIQSYLHTTDWVVSRDDLYPSIQYIRTLLTRYRQRTRARVNESPHPCDSRK